MIPQITSARARIQNPVLLDVKTCPSQNTALMLLPRLCSLLFELCLVLIPQGLLILPFSASASSHALFLVPLPMPFMFPWLGSCNLCLGPCLFPFNPLFWQINFLTPNPAQVTYHPHSEQVRIASRVKPSAP